MEQTIEEQKDDSGENLGNDNFKENGKHNDFWCNKVDKKTGTKKWRCADCHMGETYDIKPEFNAYHMKDKRITKTAFLKSLIESPKFDLSLEAIEKLAQVLTDELYRKYPLEEK